MRDENSFSSSILRRGNRRSETCWIMEPSLTRSRETLYLETHTFFKFKTWSRNALQGQFFVFISERVAIVVKLGYRTPSLLFSIKICRSWSMNSGIYDIYYRLWLGGGSRRASNSPKLSSSMHAPTSTVLGGHTHIFSILSKSADSAKIR